VIHPDCGTETAHHLGWIRRRHPDPDPEQSSIDLTSRHH